MEYLNRDYEFMDANISTHVHSYVVNTTKACELQLALLDMVTARIKELHPEKTCKTYQASEFTKLANKQKQLDFKNPLSPENMTIIPPIIPLGIVEFEWSKDVILALTTSNDVTKPGVLMRFFRVLWSFNPMMNTETRIISPEGPIMDLNVLTSGVCQMTLYKEYRTDDKEINNMFELFRHLSALPRYARQFDIFKES